MKYRKKPVVIEAILYNGDNGNELYNWSNGVVVESPIAEATNDYTNGSYVQIKTLEGTMTGIIGDWIIKGVKGEFYPCKPDIFEATYEKADNQI
jgi:uncharacterized protein affecting Mg2+/Co2+ transport